MQLIQGSCLSLPIRADARGSLATVSGLAATEVEIISVIETVQGERLLMPDFGLPDFAFSVKGTGASKALAYLLRQQVLTYVPLVESLDVTGVEAGEHEINIHIVWRARGSNVPNNLVYPTRRMASA
jgi:hypothetical protein